MGNFWKAHGTKILGSLGAAWGLVQTVAVTDPNVLSGLGPWGPIISAVLAALTVKRGFTNTANKP